MPEKQDFWSKLDRLCPPGMTYTRIWGTFLTILILGFGIWWAGLFSLLSEVENYKINLAQGMYDHWDGAVTITTIRELMYIFVTFSKFACFFLLCFIIPNYQYFRKDSKSVYLMKRVQNRMEIHKLCCTLPVMAALTVMILAILLYVIFTAIYLNYVPAGCMPADPFGRYAL